MTITRRFAIALSVLCLFSSGLRAQVMSQVPANSLAVLHVNNMRQLSQKFADWNKQAGLNDNNAPPDSYPAVSADLLGYVTNRLKLNDKAVKLDGDMALALINNLIAMNGPNPPLIALVPVNDYQAFINAFPGNTTDGAISTLAGPDGSTFYASNWGSYAALSPAREVLATARPGGLVLTDAAQKEVDSKDVCVIANMPAIRGLVIPLLVAGRQAALNQMLTTIGRSPGGAEYAGVARVAFNQLTDLFQHLLTDCDDITYGLALGSDGLTTSFLADFKPDSRFGQLTAAALNTDKSLLDGLPDGKYLTLAGTINDPKVGSQLLGEFLDPIMVEVAKVGPDAQFATDIMQAMKDLVAAQTGMRLGIVVPEGELGTSPLLQQIAIRTGDAKALHDVNRKLLQSLPAEMKAMNPQANQMFQQTYTPAAKTIDGVVFDQSHTSFDMGGAAADPNLLKLTQFFTFAYGQDGLSVYGGVVNDSTELSVAGLTDDKISAAIAAAKNDADTLGAQPGIQSTAGHLPKSRQAVVYFPIDVLANTAFTYVAKFGLDMGVTFPPCDPIGVTVATENSAIRVDSYIPTKLVASSVTIVKKLNGAGAPPSPPAPPAPAAQ
jgi:hypothetical protein